MRSGVFVMLDVAGHLKDERTLRTLREAIQHLNSESPRVLFDLSMRLHWIEPQATSPVFVLGAIPGDRVGLPRR